MSRFPLFEGSNCGKYSNALHAAYHAAQYEVLEEHPTIDERAHVSDEKKEEYHGYVEELQDRNKVAQASLDTQETTVHDSERDRLLSLLFLIVTNALSALDAGIKAAAQLLEIVLRKYKGIQGEPDDAETNSIRGLLVDLRKEENQEAVTTLNLDTVLTSLETANDAFAAKKSSRIQAKYERKLQITTEELRKLADETLLEIQDAIRASGIIASLTEGQQDTVTFIEGLMQKMNAVTSNYKTTLKLSESQKAAKKPANGGENTKPTEPETPEEPTEDTEEVTEN